MQEYLIYTTHCPKCKILEKKLKDKGIPFKICDEPEELAKAGIRSVPVLESPDGTRMDYFSAVKFVNAM